MKAHQLDANGVILNTIVVASLDVIPGLVDAAIGGSIGDSIINGVVVPAPALGPIVPLEVTRRQATEALLKRDQYDAVLALLDDPVIEPDPLQRRVNLNEFQTSQVFERYRPLTIAMGMVLGIDLDEWFIFASGL